LLSAKATIASKAKIAVKIGLFVLLKVMLFMIENFILLH